MRLHLASIYKQSSKELQILTMEEQQVRMHGGSVPVKTVEEWKRPRL